MSLNLICTNNKTGRGHSTAVPKKSIMCLLLTTFLGTMDQSSIAYARSMTDKEKNVIADMFLAPFAQKFGFGAKTHDNSKSKYKWQA